MRRLSSIKAGVGCLFVFVLVNACNYNSNDWQDEYSVVATTGMIGDALENILPAPFKIHTLMGAGIDPHTYEAKPLDISKLSRAKTIVYNGLHLEGKMTKILSKLRNEKNVITISEGLPENELLSVSGSMHDPHIWLDPFLWSKGIENLGKKLAQKYPQYRSVILANTINYVQSIAKMGQWMQKELNAIPQQQRILITSHDAFHYFGKVFHVKVEALQGISTISEPGIQTVENLRQLIIKNNIQSLFVESSVAQKSVQALQEACERKGYRIKTGGTLYSDAMGDKSENAETYLKMLKKNTETIVKGLSN